MNRNTQIKSMPEGYAMCRVLVGNHVPAPGYPVVNRTAEGYEQMFVCANCGAEVYRYRDRHGFLTGKRSYSYEPGYLLDEGGRMTKSEKAQVFVSLARGSGGTVTKIRKNRRAAS